jgi:hypothetical protein
MSAQNLSHEWTICVDRWAMTPRKIKKVQGVLSVLSSHGYENVAELDVGQNAELAATVSERLNLVKGRKGVVRYPVLCHYGRVVSIDSLEEYLAQLDGVERDGDELAEKVKLAQALRAEHEASFYAEQAERAKQSDAPNAAARMLKHASSSRDLHARIVKLGERSSNEGAQKHEPVAPAKASAWSAFVEGVSRPFKSLWHGDDEDGEPKQVDSSASASASDKEETTIYHAILTTRHFRTSTVALRITDSGFERWGKAMSQLQAARAFDSIVKIYVADETHATFAFASVIGDVESYTAWNMRDFVDALAARASQEKHITFNIVYAKKAQ